METTDRIAVVRSLLPFSTQKPPFPDVLPSLCPLSSAVRKITRFDTSSSLVSIAALVPEGSESHEYDPKRLLAPSDLGPTARFVRYATLAAKEAMEDARWIPTSDAEKQSTGVAIGSGIASMEDIEESHQTFLTSGARKLSPYFIPKILINTAAGHISIKYGLKGPNHAVSTACATGAHSLGDAAHYIASGFADVMVAGSTEATVTPLTISGFARARALSTKYQDTPEKSSRPFDAGRDGFVIGEGAGVMVLEELEHAIKRGAKIYGELRGYGLAGDAHHLTAPCPSGSGAYRAMSTAVARSGLHLSDIGYVNAHATSTPLGDVIESKAIQRLFSTGYESNIIPPSASGPSATMPLVSSTKGATGHLLGGAGSVEAIFALLAMRDGIIPPTLNLDNVDPECTLDYVALTARKQKFGAVMSNSFGFGGTNASVIFSEL